jgi:glycosyltransferase involved in cell wall biosynthesis
MPIGTFFPSQAGGPSNTMYWIASALYDHGIQSTVVTTMGGIEDSSIGNKWQTTRYGKIIYYDYLVAHLPLKMIFQSIRNLHRHDIVHLTAFFSPPSWLCFLYNHFITHKPVIWSIRGEFHNEALQFSKFRKKIILKILFPFINKSIRFHATSIEEKNDIAQILGEKSNVFVLPNYMLLPEKLDVPIQKYLLFIGRLHPIKCLELIIESCANSKNFMESNFQLWIAGKGDTEYTAKLQSLVTTLSLESKVKWLGHVEGVEKEKLFASSYATILMSKSENFGNVVIESLAQGTPVIASKGTPWSILNEKEAGHHIPSDINSLSATIDSLISLDAPTYMAMRENAYNLVKNNFDINANAYKWVNEYNELINYIRDKNK